MGYDETCKYVADLWRFYFESSVIDANRLTDFENECKSFGVDSIDVFNFI